MIVGQEYLVDHEECLVGQEEYLAHQEECLVGQEECLVGREQRTIVMISDHQIMILYDQKWCLDHQKLDFMNENAWKPSKSSTNSNKKLILTRSVGIWWKLVEWVGSKLLKICFFERVQP